VDTRTGDVVDAAEEQRRAKLLRDLFGGEKEKPSGNAGGGLPKDWVEVHRLADKDCSVCNGHGHKGRLFVSKEIILCECVLAKVRGEVDLDELR